MVVYFNVFSSGVKHGVASEVDAAHRIRDGNAQVLQNLLEPLYLASVLDSATVGCFLLLQQIAPLPMENTNLDVDRRSAL